MFILALLTAVLYFKLDKKDFNDSTVINDWTGALFFIVLGQFFTTLSAIDLFIKEGPIFM